jgi:glycosyltransferase involved in cell wall biosynthesis
MKKKIIFIAQALWLGGIETALVNLLNHLNYEKYDITCLITEDYQTMADRITPKCRLLVADRSHTVSFSEPYRYSRIYNLMEEPQNATTIRRAAWKGLRTFLRAPEVRLYSNYLCNQLKGEHFDTAIIYSDRMAEIAVRSINADRYLMFYHNADLGRAYHDEYGYRRSEKIIAVSESQCEKLKKLCPQYASKMISIPNYIDAESVELKANVHADEPLFPHPGIHLVSCGRLAYQKGFDIAVEACAKIVKSGWPQLHWYILGVGPEKSALEDRIHQFRMEEHFHLIGAKENPFPYMKQADLYVQPSRTEGYSLSILEARVLACPMVATIGAAGEQIEDGVTGTLCQPDADSISEAIIKHLSDPSIGNLYKTALSSFSFSDINQTILERIQDLL